MKLLLLVVCAYSGLKTATGAVLSNPDINLEEDLNSLKADKRKCLKDGPFPDRENCQRFYLCSDGETFIMNCPADLHYDTVLQRCEYRETARCGKQTLIECTSKEQGKQRQHCDVDGTIEIVGVHKQLSKTTCYRDRTYGYFGSSIWVDSGCNAIFKVKYFSVDSSDDSILYQQLRAKVPSSTGTEPKVVPLQEQKPHTKDLSDNSQESMSNIGDRNIVPRIYHESQLVPSKIDVPKEFSYNEQNTANEDDDKNMQQDGLTKTLGNLKDTLVNTQDIIDDVWQRFGDVQKKLTDFKQKLKSLNKHINSENEIKNM